MAETGALNPSEHFNFAQMVVAGADPTPQQASNLVALCDGSLELVRSLLNAPLEIVKGLDPSDPEHAEGLAADFLAPGWIVNDAVAAIQGHLEIPQSAVRLEEGADGIWHIHFAIGEA